MSQPGRAVPAGAAAAVAGAGPGPGRARARRGGSAKKIRPARPTAVWNKFDTFNQVLFGKLVRLQLFRKKIVASLRLPLPDERSIQCGAGNEPSSFQMRRCQFEISAGIDIHTRESPGCCNEPTEISTRRRWPFSTSEYHHYDQHVTDT